MKQVYNVQTGQLEDLTTDKIQEGILAGTHAFLKGQKVNILDPNGKSYSMDASELPEAFQAGWKLETPDETNIREYVKENQGLSGTAKVFGKQFIDEALLGIPELIQDKTEDPLELAKRDALKKDHELANAMGGIAGFAATILPSMGTSVAAKLGVKSAGKFINPAGALLESATKAGTAVESKIASKLASSSAPQVLKDMGAKAAGYATEGAIIAAPHAITEASLGDPSEAAETIMAGGIFGGVLGASVPGLKKVGKWALDKADYIKNFLPKEQESAFNAIGATAAQREKLMQRAPDVVEKMPQFLRDLSKGDKSILTNPEKLMQKMKDVESVSGKAIGDIVQQLDDRVKAISIGADDAALAELKPNMYDYSKLAKKIEEKYIIPYQNDIRYAPQLDKVKQELQAIDQFVKSNFGGDIQPIDFKSLREFQQKTKELVNFDKKNNIADLGTDARKEIIDDIQLYFKDRLAPQIKETFPELSSIADQFKAYNDMYRMAININPVIAKKVSKEQVAPFLKMGDLVAGGVGGIGGLVGKKFADKAKGLYDVGGLLVSSDMMKSVAKKFDAIPRKLAEYQKPARSAAQLSIGELTGNEENNDYDKLQEKLQAFADNPQHSEFFYDLGGMGETGAPQISQALQMKSIEVAQYLLSKLPKPLTPNNPLVKGKTYKPSSMEMAKFNRILKTVIDPMSVVDSLNDNNLTTEQVQTLADLYPTLLEKMKLSVMDTVDKNPEAIPYNKRIKLSLLLGMDLDPSITQANAAIIIGSQEQQPEEPKGNPNANFTNYPSDLDRIRNNIK